MSPRDISDTSTIILLFRHFYKCYGKIEQRLIGAYHSSQVYGLLNKFWEKTKVCFRYSFLAKITEIKQTPSGALDNSRTMQYLINFYKRRKDKPICYLKSSFTLGLVRDTKKELLFSPVRIISIIIVTAILVNVVLSMLFHKPIVLWGWLMRVLFLLAGIAGLFCKADWFAVKNGSRLLRMINIHKYVRDLRENKP